MPPLLSLTTSSIGKDLTICAQNLKGRQHHIVRHERGGSLCLVGCCHNPIRRLDCLRGAYPPEYPRHWLSRRMYRHPVPPRPFYNPCPLNPSRDPARKTSVRSGTIQGKLMYDGVEFKQHLSGGKAIAIQLDERIGVDELETVVHEGAVRRSSSLRFTNRRTWIHPLAGKCHCRYRRAERRRHASSHFEPEQKRGSRARRSWQETTAAWGRTCLGCFDGCCDCAGVQLW